MHEMRLHLGFDIKLISGHWLLCDSWLCPQMPSYFESLKTRSNEWLTVNTRKEEYLQTKQNVVIQNTNFTICFAILSLRN